MARNDGIDRTVARNQDIETADDLAKVQEHNEREKGSYSNQDIVPECSSLNIHFKEPTAGYEEMFTQMEQDKVLNYISHAGFTNSATDKLKIIFVPCYLDGRDGILNKPYYDLLIGMDATVYPSYYEPWGYTPLESIAFGIPTITTDLAGFGLWAKKHVTGNNISEGVAVVNRDDFNYFEVADAITSSILALAGKDKKETAEIRKRSFCLAAKAEWSKFIVYYEEAFRIALEHASKRNN